MRELRGLMYNNQITTVFYNHLLHCIVAYKLLEICDAGGASLPLHPAMSD